MSDTFENKGALASTIVVAASDSLNKGQANFVADGVNDHIEIQAALDALPATGGEVKLLDGTYNIEVSLVMDSYQTLRGCGHNSILTTAALADPIISAGGGAGTELVHIIIADLQIDGASTAYAGIYWNYVDYSKISNVWIHDCIYDKGVTEWGGIQLCNCDFDELLGNICIDNWLGICLGDFIAIDYPCTFITIAGNSISSNGFYGISLFAGSIHNRITHNTCQGNDTHGIYIDNSNNNAITGNTCQGNDAYGIYIDISNNNAITGNTIQGNSIHGIYTDNSNNNAITGNTIQGNGGHGIYIDISNNNAITGNTIQGNGRNGICVTDSDNNSITGNTCVENSQISDNVYDNIYLDVESDYNLIADNICRMGVLVNKPRYGISIQDNSCNHNMVHGNNLYDSGSTGDLNDAGTNTHKRDNLSNVGAWLADV